MHWPTVAPVDPEFHFPFSLSVFFPAYNDAPSLPQLVARTAEILRRTTADFEIIVVNDGSTDATAEVLEQLRSQYQPFLRIVTHPRNLGYGSALRSGFAAATKEFVFYTDGDGQYDPAELELLLRAVVPDTALVNGYKRERRDPWHRIAIGWLYNRFARRLFRIRLRDIDCDFRLIRRSALDLSTLQSTGGTICIELVRSLELSGSGVVELPVHHYPRQHGRSQFFRMRSLVTTFLQLCAVFLRLVVAPALHPAAKNGAPLQHRRGPSRRTAVFMFLCLCALSLFAYTPSLQLPFISDDYVQIHLAREFGPVSGWPALARDALYRCRATSLVMTYWTERALGLDPMVYKLSSLGLHVLVSFLVFLLGSWRRIGWKAAAVAAGYYAVAQRHSEAVVWYAALPELLVVLFSLASFLCWVQWMQSDRRAWIAYAASLSFYVLALFSKESAVAVVPLCLLALLCEERRRLQRFWAAAPFALLAGAYFAMAFAARSNHLHFNDGTFSLQAPFWSVLVRSAAGAVGLWGAASLLALQLCRVPQRFRLLPIAGAWIAITLLPYSFLTYMPQVPSRHTYFAGVGVALVIAAGLLALQQWASARKRIWLAVSVGIVLLTEQSTYIWTKKQYQYAQRAEPTEKLVREASRAPGPVYATCFPYSPIIGELALQYRLPQEAKAVFITGAAALKHPGAVNLCNAVAHE